MTTIVFVKYYITPYAHQYYIYFVENPGNVYYENGVSFIPSTLQKVLAIRDPQRHFRNECLCKAMVHFNMLDTVSRGIKKISKEQWWRYFPMPDYEIDAANKVIGVRLYDNAINEKYTKIWKRTRPLLCKSVLLLMLCKKDIRLTKTQLRIC